MNWTNSKERRINMQQESNVKDDNEDFQENYNLKCEKSASKDNLQNIYQYFIHDYLEKLSKIPLENQLNELTGRRILVLDFCGMISKYHFKFKGCDIFLVNNISEVYHIANTSDFFEKYDVIYILKSELQEIYLRIPAIYLICYRNRISKIIFLKDPSKHP